MVVVFFFFFFCRFCDQFFLFLVSLPFVFVLNGCLLQMRKNKLGIRFQSMKYCCCHCKYCQDETKNSCTVFLWSLRVLWGGERLKKEGRREKRGDDSLSTGLTITLRNPQRTVCVCLFFPCHAFYRGLFPVGSALEVAPASVSLISADRTMLYWRAVR